LAAAQCADEVVAELKKEGAIYSTTFDKKRQEDLPLVRRISTRSTLDRDLLRTAKRFDKRQTPGSELMFENLKELGRSVLVSDAEYQETFDRFEIILGLLTIDAGGWATGCFAWRDGLRPSRLHRVCQTRGLPGEHAMRS